MERSAIREIEIPGFAALHPGYELSFSSTHRLRLWRDRHLSREKIPARKKIFADYQP